MNIKLIGSACLSTLIFCACNDGKPTTNKTTTPQAYQALTLEPRSTVIYTDFPATIEGIEIIQLRPMVDGYLEKIYVPEGANVSKGQLLFQIQNPV